MYIWVHCISYLGVKYFKGLVSDPWGLISGTVGLKSDLWGLKSDPGGLKSDLGGLKSDHQFRQICHIFE